MRRLLWWFDRWRTRAWFREHVHYAPPPIAAFKLIVDEDERLPADVRELPDALVVAIIRRRIQEAVARSLRDSLRHGTYRRTW